MLNVKTFLKLFLLAGIFTLGVLVSPASVSAANTYYVATNGSDGNNGSLSSPWATFAYAQSINNQNRLAAGDTLYIKNGTYTENLIVTVSGTSDNYITFKALSDGGVTIDGNNNSVPLNITLNSYINVEGIIFRNGITRTAYIGFGKAVKIKRCSFYDNYQTGTDYATVIFNASTATNYSEAYLLEDSAVQAYWGMVDVLYANYTIIRRVWQNGNYGPAYIYLSDDVIVENTIDTPYASGDTVLPGFGPHTNDSDHGNNNRLYGNISFSPSTGTRLHSGMQVSVRKNTNTYHQTSGNHFKDFVVINAKYNGGYYMGDDSLLIENVTLVWDGDDTGSKGFNFYRGTGSTVTLNTTIKNSSLVGHGNGQALYIENDSAITIENTYNNYFNFSANYAGKAMAGTSETYIIPNYDTSTYGKGSYLMVPSALKLQGENRADIGAEVLYRYIDGVETSTPLWPWPMEERICAEAGYSVTYENPTNCKQNGTNASYGDGLWKTLEGVYDDNSADTTPPAAPTGVRVR